MKKALIVFTVLFFSAIAILTFTARDIHNAMLPHVTVKRLTREVFSGNYRRLAVPKELIQDGDIFILVSRTVGGEKRSFAQQVTLETGAENDQFYEVTSGMRGHEFVIFGSDREIRDGDEVLVVK